MFEFLKKLGASRSLAGLEARVKEINELESEVRSLSSEALIDASKELRARAREKEESLDAILPRAFALARSAAERTLGQRPFDVQLMGGITLHQGAVAEMITGEGKTLSAVLPAYLNALTGRGVHVVTVNEYLARRDAVWMGQIYRALGMSVACLVPNTAYLYDPDYKAGESPRDLDKERDQKGSFIVQQEFLRPATRREAYQADITYGTNHEFGFDYLRDNLVYRTEDQAQRGHYFAIIDEVDSILIDEARTPLIIAAPDAKSSEYYKTFARVAERLLPDADFTVDEKRKSVAITEAGIAKVEKMIGVQNLYAPEYARLVHYLDESLKARTLFLKDRDYVVKGGEVIIVDEFTGRMLMGRRYSAGLHQAIEAKEGVYVKEESRTFAKISIQNYFRMYEKISGMTGTAQTSAEEFHKVYKLEVVSIPPNRPLARKDLSDAIYKNANAKLDAVVREVNARHEKGQPILLGTPSIEKNEMLSARLRKAGIPHEVLNAKNNEREGAIIAQAGKLKAVTVATNVAGRGVDIILGGNPPAPGDAEKIRELGGLHVIGTERHEARRIDNQLRGRAGRQGDPGSSQFFLSLEDDLLRIFGGDRIKGLMDRFDLPEDQPIDVKILSRALQQAQARVEGHNFDIRKHLLEYDDVLNKQRTAVYRKRQEVLSAIGGPHLGEIIHESTFAYFEVLMNEFLKSEVEVEGRTKDDLKKVFVAAGIVAKEAEYPEGAHEENLRELVEARLKALQNDLNTGLRVLGILDSLWMNHLEDLEALQESIGLRAYGQKEPLVEFRREGHRLYESFWSNFDAWIFMNLFRTMANNPQPIAAHSHGSANISEKVGRNDPCPCGSGKKYKKCGLVNSEEHQKNMQNKK